MSQTSHRAHHDVNSHPKWFNSPVTCHEGSLLEVGAQLPSFERRCFSLAQRDYEETRLNERLDTIVRLPFRDDRTVVPVGVVSKDYALLPHTKVLEIAMQALDASKIPPSEVKAQLKITEYGERMALSMYLPARFQFDPGDGHPMALRLECLNSVDGSTRFRALIGWFRFVCSNGLIIGVTRADLHRRHIGDFQLQDIDSVLRSGIEESDADKKNFENWRRTPVKMNRLAVWVEGSLRKGWGFKAATRAYHIARTGTDVEIAGQYKGSTPTSIAVQEAQRVPGAPEQSQNLYDVSQILAWLAKERRDIQEQLEWREGIPAFMDSLIKS